MKIVTDCAARTCCAHTDLRLSCITGRKWFITFPIHVRLTFGVPRTMAGPPARCLSSEVDLFTTRPPFSRNVGTGLCQGATSHSTPVVRRRHVAPRASTVGARGARFPLVVVRHYSSLLGCCHGAAVFLATSPSPVTVVKMLARRNWSLPNRGPARYDCTRRHVGSRRSWDSKPGSTGTSRIHKLRLENRLTPTQL